MMDSDGQATKITEENRYDYKRAFRGSAVLTLPNGSSTKGNAFSTSTRHFEYI